MPVPTPQEQVQFLQSIQRLLTEGLFVASYKFALLRALADLAVAKGDDTGEELELHADEIAAAMIEVYWRQTRPFGEDGGTILRQNTGRPAAILNAIAGSQAEHGPSLPQLKGSEAWRALVRDVAQVVCVMPLWKLQRVGDDVLEFLYPNVGRGRVIRLKPGVVYCLRRFYGILRNLIEGAWIDYVRNANLPVLGHAADIGAFLFGVERASLQIYQPFLRDLQRGTCFYCRGGIRGTGDVDHFLPWARYPIDLGHNFVLAHRECNNAKRDYLAAEQHLAAWRERNEVHAVALLQFFEQAQIVSDVRQSLSIARWAYSQTAGMQGLVWVQNGELGHLGGEWERLLAG